MEGKQFSSSYEQYVDTRRSYIESKNLQELEIGKITVSLAIGLFTVSVAFFGLIVSGHNAIYYKGVFFASWISTTISIVSVFVSLYISASASDNERIKLDNCYVKGEQYTFDEDVNKWITWCNRLSVACLCLGLVLFLVFGGYNIF